MTTVDYKKLSELLESDLVSKQTLIDQYEKALASIVFLYEEETITNETVNKMAKLAAEALKSN